MAKDVNQHFSEAWSGVLRQAQIGATEDALEEARKIERDLLFRQSQFFPTFKKMVIGAERAPQLGEYTPRWQPLTTKWIKRKKSLDFYRGLRGSRRSTGPSLEDYVSQVKASAIFGLPRARPEMDVGGDVIGGVEMISQPKLGRQFLRGRSKRTGRFVRVEDIKKAVSAGIDVTPFPRLERYNRLVGNSAGIAAALFPQKVAYKLTNPDGTERRPILVNFIKWWAKEKIMRPIRRRYGDRGVKTNVF